MGMSLGGNSGMRAEINVTPMIDVLLVLIIIFLVITPTVSTGHDAAIPQQASDAQANAAPPRDIVISISKDHAYRLNQEPIELAALQPRLKSLCNLTSAAAIFVRGDRELEFHDVIDVIDMARGAGWERIGLMTQ